MTKTTFEEPDDDAPDMSDIETRLLLISGLTAEAASRQLLDALASKLSAQDDRRQLEIASLYVRLAQSHIIADALRSLNPDVLSTLFGKGPNDE